MVLTLFYMSWGSDLSRGRRRQSRTLRSVYFPSRSWLVSTWGLVISPIALIVIALRCYSRIAITREFGYDDWMMVLVAALLAGLVALDIASTLDVLLFCF
jgi:hypothetical protein